VLFLALVFLSAGPSQSLVIKSSAISISNAKLLGNGSEVTVYGITSAVFDSQFYIESSNHCSGIQVRSSSGVPNVGQPVIVTGTVEADDATGELYIQASEWTENGEIKPVEPLALSIKYLGGSSFWQQIGVKDGLGLNNIGLLVKVSGTVTGKAVDGSHIYVSDGSGVSDGGSSAGVRIDLSSIPDAQRPVVVVGNRVIITGISSMYSFAGDYHRMVRLPSASDLINLSDDGNLPKIIKVMVINFDPVIEHKGNKRLHEVYWPTHDPRIMVDMYINDLQECSNGWALYKVVEWVDADYFPIKTDGFQYTDESFCAAWENGGPFHSPDGVNYYKVVSDKYYSYNNPKTVVERVASGEIDEVFMFGAPYFGYWESCMLGPSPYFVNGGVYYIPAAGRNFIIMGFNYERWIGEMLEDYGHRTESIMTHVYGSWNAYPPQHNWDLFTLVDKNITNRKNYTAGCGNVHFAPNSTADYQWGNYTNVYSTCDDWLYNWPNLKGTKKLVNCTEWGYGDIRAHHKWWLKHLPNKAGINPDGKQNNWWKYVADFNNYPESR